MTLLYFSGDRALREFQRENMGELTPKAEEVLLRYNQGKAQWHLMDWEALEPIVRVLEYGAAKYEPDNWKRPANREELLDSLMRHVVELTDSAKQIELHKEIDSETGLPHMAHVGCNVMFYLYHLAKGDWSDARQNPYPEKSQLEDLAKKNKKYWEDKLKEVS